MPSLAGEPLTAPDDPAIHGGLIKTWHRLACLLYFYMSMGTVLLMDMFVTAGGHVYWYCEACLPLLLGMSTTDGGHVYCRCCACLLRLLDIKKRQDKQHAVDRQARSHPASCKYDCLMWQVTTKL